MGETTETETEPTEPEPPKQEMMETKDDVQDITFDEEDEMDLEAQNAHKKAWKKMEFVENASVATEQELQKISFAPAPKSTSSKVKKKKKEPASEDNLIGLSVEFSDRLDCLLDANGQIIKHQVVGNLNLKYEQTSLSTSEDQYFYGSIS